LDEGVVDQLTYRDSNYSPVWSPDGTKIAFISTRDGRYGLYTMKANGQALKALTKGYFIDFLCPTWMPDSQRIVAAGAPTGQSFPNGSYNIYVVNANGSGVMALTSDSNADMLSHCISLFG
jgi:Tol biopolymer transport system component